MARRAVDFFLGVSSNLTTRKFSIWDITTPGSRDLVTEQSLAGSTETVSVILIANRLYEAILRDKRLSHWLAPTIERFTVGDEQDGVSGTIEVLTTEDESSSSSSSSSTAALSTSSESSSSSSTSSTVALSTSSQSVSESSQSSVSSQSVSSSSSSTASSMSSSTLL